MIDSLSLRMLKRDLIPKMIEESINDLNLLSRMKLVCKDYFTLADDLQLKLINEGSLKIEKCIRLQYPSDFALDPSPLLSMGRHNRAAFVAYVVAHPNKLFSLDLSRFRDWSDEEIQNMLEKQQSISVLQMNHTCISNETVKKIHQLHSLKHLQVRYAESIGDQELKEIITSDLLRESFLIQGSRITAKSLKRLGLLVHLKKLTVQRCPQIKDTEMIQIVKKHPGLESLSIITSDITDAALQEIVKLPLKRLELVGCGQIKDFRSISRITTLEELTIGRTGESISFLDSLERLKKFRMPWYSRIPLEKRPSFENLRARGVELKLEP